MKLVWPSLEYLPAYKDALERGWSPDNMRLEEARLEELEKIRQDPAAFIESQVDLEGKGDPIVLPDGSIVKRLPGYHKWMWDGEFCGSIGFRWTPGSEALPPTCLGHIGYAVVPWKRGLGYATMGLSQMLPDAKQQGLQYVEICTVPDNVISQKVILANGGEFIESFVPPPSVGRPEEYRFRIRLS
jgi:predicted acetyltransferase